MTRWRAHGSSCRPSLHAGILAAQGPPRTQSGPPATRAAARPWTGGTRPQVTVIAAHVVFKYLALKMEWLLTNGRRSSP